MAVALETTTTTTCNGEAEPREEGRDGIRVEEEAPKIADGSGGEAVVYKKGAWSKEEDEKLRRAVEEYGIKNWVTIEKFSGLSRPAKNCRLRWLNYLRPNLKKYPFTEEEEKLILDLHATYGNSWARIAAKLPGRSDNEIKNFWHKTTKKCKRENLQIYPTNRAKKQKQSHTNVPTTTTNDNPSSIEANANAPTKNHDYFPTNYANHTLPQFQPSIPDMINNSHLPSDAPSIPVHSPQTMISTPQPQFLSSPSSLLTTSHHQQSPTNHLPSHQTTPLFPNTPTSQNHNSILSSSPHQTSQPTEIPDHLQAPSLCQGGGVFTSLRRPPPILSSPLRRFLRETSQLPPAPRGHSVPGSAHLAANASTFLPPDSSPQMQWPSAMESPRSPLKLKLSPGIPPQYSVQMSAQTTDSPASGFQLNSPATALLSPLKLRLSIPIPSESCFGSNLPVADPTVQLNSSTSVTPLSSPQLELSQPMTVDTDHTVAPNPSLTVKGEPSSIQFPPPETSGVNTCTHEVECDCNLEIMEELRKAQARVRFLKKKLKQSSRNEHLCSDESPETTDLLRTEVPLDGNSSESTIKYCALSQTGSRTENFIDSTLRVDARRKNWRKKVMLKRIGRRKGDVIGISKPKQVKKASKENRENLESGEIMQGSINSDKATHGESSESKISSEKSLPIEEDSLGDQEQRQSIDLLDHLDNQNNVNAPNSNPWDNKLCTMQDRCSNECSSMEALLNESSNLLQHNSFKGDLFGQSYPIEDAFSSERHLPLIDAFESVYSQNLQPDDFGFSEHGLMDGNMAAKSILCESQLLMYQNPTADCLLDSSYLVSKPMMEHESLRCEQFSLQNSGGPSAKSQLCEPSFIQQQSNAADLLDSGYRVSKQIVGPEPSGRIQFSLHTDGCGKSSETATLCESAFLLHQSPETSLIDSRHLGGFDHECWTQHEEQSLIEGLLADNQWPEGQMVSQDQTFSMNRVDLVVNPMESQNWNNESTPGHIGDVLQQEQQQDNTNTMPEEFSSLLDFFPTNMQTLE